MFATHCVTRELAPRGGFEPPTFRLTAECSTIELPGNRSTSSFSFYYTRLVRAMSIRDDISMLTHAYTPFFVSARHALKRNSRGPWGQKL